MNIVIRNLADRPGDIPIISHWNGELWQSILPNCSEAEFAEYYSEICAGNIAGAAAFVATIDNVCIGTAVLNPQDSLERISELFPEVDAADSSYIASVFVDPAFRGIGVWPKLRSAVEQAAREQGIRSLYSWTKNEFVLNKSIINGWDLLGRIEILQSDDFPQGLSVDLLRKHL